MKKFYFEPHCAVKLHNKKIVKSYAAIEVHQKRAIYSRPKSQEPSFCFFFFFFLTVFPPFREQSTAVIYDSTVTGPLIKWRTKIEQRFKLNELIASSTNLNLYSKWDRFLLHSTPAGANHTMAALYKKWIKKNLEETADLFYSVYFVAYSGLEIWWLAPFYINWNWCISGTTARLPIRICYINKYIRS